jgi:hypothetical protein
MGDDVASWWVGAAATGGRVRPPTPGARDVTVTPG